VDLNPGSENLEVLRTKTISLIPTTRPVQTGISAIPDLGRAGKWGCEPRGAPPRRFYLKRTRFIYKIRRYTNSSLFLRAQAHLVAATRAETRHKF